MRQILFPSLLLAAAAAAHAHEPDVYERERIVSVASELLPLCRQEAEAHYIGMGEQVYQWTGFYHDYADTLYADGKLRVDGRDVKVHCRIPRNARERYMTMELVDPGK
jgi:hypothetical protein